MRYVPGKEILYRDGDECGYLPMVLSGELGSTRQVVSRLLKEWERRLEGPVAKKMGVSVEKFTKLMYKNSSRGDWREFADNAKKHKWVNQVALEIREHGFREKPEVEKPKPVVRIFGQLEEKRDTDGKRYVELPRLGPCDAYFIYNPDRYYR